MGIIRRAQKLHFDQVAQQEAHSAAQELGNSKGGDGRDEHHHDPADDPGNGQREDHPPEHLHPACAQVLGRLNIAPVQLLDDREDGQDHKGQEVIHHAQNHRRIGIDDVQGADAHQGQDLIEKAVIFQNGHPGIGTQKKVHPHGQHDKKHGHLPRGRARLGQEIGKGIGYEQADACGHRRQIQGVAAHLEENIQVGEVLQGELAVVIGEGVHHNEQQRHHHKYSHPHHIGNGGGLSLHRQRPPHPPRQSRDR